MSLLSQVWAAVPADAAEVAAEHEKAAVEHERVAAERERVAAEREKVAVAVREKEEKEEGRGNPIDDQAPDKRSRMAKRKAKGIDVNPPRGDRPIEIRAASVATQAAAIRMATGKTPALEPKTIASATSNDNEVIVYATDWT